MSANVNVAVVLGDPRLPYSYSPTGRFGEDELEAVQQLKSALAKLSRYTFHYFDDHCTLVQDLAKARPDLVFNLCDTGFKNDWFRTSNIPALLELLELPYTGATPAGINLSDDKVMSMSSAGMRGVPVPKHHFIDLTREPLELPDFYPALIKPNLGMGSFGIDESSIVDSAEQAVEQCKKLRPHLQTPELIAQEFLPGGEYTMGILGNSKSGFRVLPVLEADFTALEDGLPRILTHGSKADPDSPYWKSLAFKRAELPAQTIDAMAQSCQGAFERLGLRDYARFDFRSDSAGNLKLIDENCNPTWYENGKIAMMAGWDGIAYPRLLEMILESALARHDSSSQ